MIILDNGVERQATTAEIAEVEARRAAANSLTTYKKSYLAQINAFCDQILKDAVSTYPEYEVQTFSRQELEARSYLANNAADTPMLDEICSQRGLAKSVLVNRIIQKANSLAEYSGKIIGFRQKLETSIESANSVNDLIAIDIVSAWPA